MSIVERAVGENAWRRTALMLAGLVVMAYGTALSAHAGLGATPISTLPFVLSEGLPFSFGAWVFIFNSVLLLAQIAMKRGIDANITLQIPVLILFSVLCDVAYWTTDFIEQESYWVSWAETLASIAVMGLGIALTLRGNISFRPADGFTEVVAERFHKDYGTFKLIVDMTVILLACIASMCLFGELYGVREGSIAAMLLTGPTERLISKHIGFTDSWGDEDAPRRACADIRHSVGSLAVPCETGTGTVVPGPSQHV